MTDTIYPAEVIHEGRTERIEITDEMRAQIERLAGIGCTWDEITYIIAGPSVATLQRHCTEDFQRGRNLAKATVKQGLWSLIQAGDRTAIMFFLKTQCGWRETNRTELTGKDGEAIETKATVDQKVELTPDVAFAIAKALEKEF